MNKDRIKFIHVPKTGGETVETLLKISKNHHILSERKDIKKRDYLFTIVRNPYTRLYSWYNHLRKHLYKEEIIKNTNPLNNKTPSFNITIRNERMHPLLHGDLASQYDFENWIKIMLSDKDKYEEGLISPLKLQVYYLKDKNGRIGIPESNILRFENYENELKKLFDRVKYPQLKRKIMKANHSFSNQDIKSVYNQELKNLVYEHFKEDFETFGYSKDSI